MYGGHYVSVSAFEGSGSIGSMEGGEFCGKGADGGGCALRGPVVGHC